jgi:hypothetical protein
LEKREIEKREQREESVKVLGGGATPVSASVPYEQDSTPNIEYEPARPERAPGTYDQRATVSAAGHRGVGRA